MTETNYQTPSEKAQSNLNKITQEKLKALLEELEGKFK